MYVTGQKQERFTRNQAQPILFSGYATRQFLVPREKKKRKKHTHLHCVSLGCTSPAEDKSHSTKEYCVNLGRVRLLSAPSWLHGAS